MHEHIACGLGWPAGGSGSGRNSGRARELNALFLPLGLTVTLIVLSFCGCFKRIRGVLQRTISWATDSATDDNRNLGLVKFQPYTHSNLDGSAALSGRRFRPLMKTTVVLSPSIKAS